LFRFVPKEKKKKEKRKRKTRKTLSPPQILCKQGKKPHAIFYDTKKHVKIATKYSIKSLQNPLPFHG